MVDTENTRRTTDAGQLRVLHTLPTGELKNTCSLLLVKLGYMLYNYYKYKTSK